MLKTVDVVVAECDGPPSYVHYRFKCRRRCTKSSSSLKPQVCVRCSHT